MEETPQTKPPVYLETSVISLLTARPTKNPIVNGNQDITRDWWNTRRDRFELKTSQLVVDEASQGDEAAANERKLVLEKIPLIVASSDAIALAEEFIRQHALPPVAAQDSLHIAIAAYAACQILLTWNCRHIANAAIKPKIEATCNQFGLTCPMFCTPAELMEIEA